MQLSAIFLLGICLQVSASGVSQTITFSGNKVPLENVFIAIEKQTGYFVVYYKKDIETAKPVSVNAKNQPLQEFIKEVLKDQGLEFLIKEKTISVKKSLGDGLKQELLISPLLTAPPITVRGRIVNEKGEPVVASVVVKGTNRGTTTDSYGNYLLESVADDAVLVISGVNVETQEIMVNNRKEIAITAITRIGGEEEVIVSTDYWSTSKKRSTGNITKVAGKDIEKQPITSLLNSLVGRVAGLDVTPLNGAPGSSLKVEIRGNNSLRVNSSYPLYVVDGIQIDAKPIQSFSGSVYNQGYDPLSNIDPQNIENIEVLKDATATAIYGSRGANGVIRITTRKPNKIQKTSVDFNAYQGFGKMVNRMGLLNTSQYLEMRNEAFKNSGTVPGASDYDMNGRWDTSRYTDWQKELLGGSASVSDIHAGISGGSSNTSYRVNAGYHKENTIYPGDFGFERANADLSLNYISNDKKFNFLTSLNYGRNENKGFDDLNFVNYALNLSPVAPSLLDSEGHLNWQEFEVSPGVKTHSFNNPLANLLNTDEAVSNNILASVVLSYEILPGLIIKNNATFSDYISNEVIKKPILARPPAQRATASGTASFASNRRTSFMLEPQLSYSKDISYHNINVIIGGAWQNRNSSYDVQQGTGYKTDALLNTLQGATTITAPASDQAKYKYAALFGRVGYNYKNKYLVDLTGRRDGSSRFGPNKKYGNFSAVGVGWVLTEEDFIPSNQKFLSFAKLRASYGSTGNDQIGDYQYNSTFSPTGFIYQDGITLVPTALFNPDFAWEVTRKTELAMELGLFNNRVSIEAAYYHNKSSNQLINYKLPGAVGFSSVFMNFGATVENSGVELLISSDIIRSKSFWWKASFNISIPENKLTKFDSIENSSYALTYKVGEPLSIQRLYTYGGIDPLNGDYIITDLDESGSINSGDRSFMQPLGRKYYGGVLNSLGYKNFELSFLFQFSKNAVRNFLLTTTPGTASNQPVEVLNRWRKEGDITDVARFVTTGKNVTYFNNFVRQSDANFSEISFARLKTLSLSYRFIKGLFGQFIKPGSTIYIQGQNLLTFTSFSGLDPEASNSLPPLRIVSLGFQFKF